MNADLSLYTSEARAQIEINLAKTAKPFYIEPSAECSWDQIVDFEKKKCAELYAQYSAFTDKRTSAAKHIKTVWTMRCVRLHFYRIYAAESC